MILVYTYYWNRFDLNPEPYIGIGIGLLYNLEGRICISLLCICLLFICIVIGIGITLSVKP